jgi:sec-independent protein translocase protein TatC
MARRPQDDLFEGTKMTFGEHIEELRGSLFQAIIGLFIGVALGFMIASTVVQWIQTPLKAALDNYYLEKALEDEGLKQQFGGEIPYEIKAVIREHKLGPATMKVSPDRLIETLKEANAGEFGSVELKPHALRADDLNRDSLPEFLDTWRESGETDDAAPAGALWRLLSDSERQQIAELADKEKLTAADRNAVAGVLNVLIGRRTTHDAAELATLKGTDGDMAAALDALRSRREKKGFTAEDSRRFNRLLLSAAFPDYIGPPRVQLIDLPFWTPIDIKVQSLGAQEAFMIWMKAAFIVGLVISAPWVFLKIWQFVAAGLYPHEKHYIYIYLPISLILFFGGAALAFFFVFQPVLSFLFSFNKSMNIDPDPRISEWLSFVLFLPLGFGISFQLPLVMLFLQRIGIFSVEMYLAKWRIAILAIFVISMVLTPADPISMLLMACPLSVLYFGGLAMCKWMPRGRNPYSQLQAYEP